MLPLGRKEPATVDADDLRREAERCFRLARAVNDPHVVAQLEELGHDLESRASALERAAGEDE